MLIMLAAVQLPAGALVPALAVGAAALLAITLAWRRWPKAKNVLRTGLAIGLAASVAALGVLGLHRLAVVQPIQRLAGAQHDATARVMTAETSYGGETMRVTLRVLTLDGEKPPYDLTVSVAGFAEVQVGDVVRAQLSFYELGGSSARYSYAKGQYVGARAAGDVQVVGRDVTLLCRLRLLQYKASENIRARLPQRLSGIAAAMSVGDKRYLSAETRAAYRAAGLTHVLVVSGLHLSILCGALYAVAKSVFRRRWAASVFCMAFVVLFMLFTGFSPSVVRSGVAFLLVYAATLFRRRTDIFTSLAVAALVLCTLNPYAAVDVGLLLSFTATLGALAGGRAAEALKRRQNKEAPRYKRALGALACAATVPVCVTLATLPVLLCFGMGVSLLSIPANILAVPLATPVVLAGLVMALPLVPVLNWLAGLAALAAGFLLVLLEKITGLCALVPGASVYVGGAVAVAVLLLYPLGLLAFKSRRVKAYALAGLVVLGMGIGLHAVLSYGVVRVTVVGSGAATSVVVTQNGQAAVLYRDRRTLAAVQDVMLREGAEHCALVVDMRQNSQGTETGRLRPDETVVVADDVVSKAIYKPFGDVAVYIARQAKGMVVCVEVAGYRVGVVSGSVNLTLYAPLQALVPARARPEGEWGTLLCAGAPPEWATSEDNVLVSNGRPYILIRPGKSAVYREVYDGDMG